MASTLKEATDARLLIVASVEYIEKTPFNVLVAHNGSEIIDEILTPYESAQNTLGKINELVEKYIKYTKDLCELQTDNRDLIRLAASKAGIFVRPKRKQEIEVFVRRTLESYMRDEIFSEPNEEPKKKRSKWRTWLINVLQYAINKLEGERKQ
jgi:hypothetical protein